MDYEAVFNVRLAAFGTVLLAGTAITALLVKLRVGQRLDRLCKLRPRLVVWLYVLGTVVFLAYFGTLTLLRHYDLQTSILDLGNVEQTFWNTVHGAPFRMTTDTAEGAVPDTRLAFHVEPIILPLSLFYWLLPRTETLLLLQLLALAGSAVLVGMIARRLIDSPFAGLAFFAVALLAQPVHAALAFDIHPVVYALPAFLLAFWFVTVGRFGRAVFAGVALMLCREDAAIVALLFGAFLLLHRRSRTAGVALTILAASWLVALSAILQHFHPNGYEYLWRIEALDAVLRGGADWWTFFTAPGRLHYLLWLLTPLAFLPLAGFEVSLLGAAAVGIVLVGGTDRELLGALHYHLLGYGALVAAAIVGAARITRWLRRRGRAALTPTVAALTMTLLFSAVLGGQTALPRPDWGRLATVQEAASAIPADASVSASANVGPWVVRRAKLYILESPRRSQADFVLTLACDEDVCDNLPRPHYDAILEEVDADPSLRRIYDASGVRLYGRTSALTVRDAF